MTTRYDVGDLVRVTGTWTDPLNGNVEIDPDVVRLSVRAPSGTVVTYTFGSGDDIEKTETGVYVAHISITESGLWYYRWWSTGAGQSAEEGELVVNEQMVVA